MKKILIAVAGSALLGAFAVPYAKLPAPTPEENAAAAAKTEKETTGKAKAAKELAEAQDRAAASYRKSKGKSAVGVTRKAKPGESSASAPTPSRSQGADHANSRLPDADLTRREAQNQMPQPGQANDHSTTARDPQNSSGR
jgi:hypothetical protein